MKCIQQVWLRNVKGYELLLSSQKNSFLPLAVYMMQHSSFAFHKMSDALEPRWKQLNREQKPSVSRSKALSERYFMVRYVATVIFLLSYGDQWGMQQKVSSNVNNNGEILIHHLIFNPDGVLGVKFDITSGHF